jgi:LPXTG-motif cell wall-anchored protein
VYNYGRRGLALPANGSGPSGAWSGITEAQRQAAVQVAVWSIMYTYGIAGQGGLVAQGAERITTFGAQTFNAGEGFRVTSANNNIIRYADFLLQQSYGKRGAGFVIRQGLNHGATTNGQTGQDLLVGVPEPSALAIAGLGALGFLGYGLRRRKKA